MTKTDSLDWTKLNSEIKFLFTKKKFFNEFYFRLNYLVPGARLITYYSDNDDFKDRVTYFNAPRFHWRGISSHHTPAVFRQICDFAKVYHCDNHLQKLKFRIEADQLSIYSNSEDYLYDIATTSLTDWKSDILSISLIESDNDRILLDQGFIIAKKPQTHPYRIKIRETFGFHQDRKCLENYLQNLGSSVKVTKYMLDRLAHGHKYFPGGYIYVNDSRVVDMLRLVSPNLIGSVQQLVTQ